MPLIFHLLEREYITVISFLNGFPSALSVQDKKTLAGFGFISNSGVITSPLLFLCFLELLVHATFFLCPSRFISVERSVESTFSVIVSMTAACACYFLPLPK